MQLRQRELFVFDGVDNCFPRVGKCCFRERQSTVVIYSASALLPTEHFFRQTKFRFIRNILYLFCILCCKWKPCSFTPYL